MAGTQHEWKILGPLLDKLGPEQRLAAIREVAAGLEREEDLTVAAWLLSTASGQSDSILDASLEHFLIRLRRTGNTSAVAKLCQQSVKARKWQLEWTASELAESLSLISLGSVRNTNPSTDVTEAQVEEARHIVISHLNFLLHMLELASGDTFLDLDATLLNAMSDALSSESVDVSRAARNVYSSWLRSSHLRRVASMGDKLSNNLTVHETLWRQVMLLVAEGETSGHRAIAFWLWLQMLDLPVDFDHLKRLMTDDVYWAYLQKALLGGDMELKRSGVAILRKSIALIDSQDLSIRNNYIQTDPNKSTVLGDYDKFCTIYETIALSRYLGQIKDSIPTLEHLAGSKSTLHASWILAVLRQAFTDQMPESVRNLFGNWVMSKHGNVSSYPEQFGPFLEDSILPWAMQAGLFMTTVHKLDLVTRCGHGESFAQFVAGLVSTPVQSHIGGETAAHIYMKTILQFLRATAHKASIYGIEYSIYGIYLAATKSTMQALTISDATILIDLSSTPGLSEPVRDSVTIMCDYILNRSEVVIGGASNAGESVAVLEAKRAIVRSKVDKLRKSTENDRKSELKSWKSVNEALDAINLSRHTCLDGVGLEVTCKSLPPLMQHENIGQCDEDTVVQVLEAIRQEVERQDYPKNALLVLPSVWLSPLCLDFLQRGSDQMRESFSYFMEFYMKMSQSRIYVWSAFALAFKSAVLDSPSALRADVFDFVTSNARRMPSARPEAKLDEAASHISTPIDSSFEHLNYEHYYGEAASVGYAAYFDLVNHLPGVAPSTAHEILNDIMQPWEAQTLPAPVMSRWKTVHQLQVMMILLARPRSGMDSDATDLETLKVLLHMLKAEQLPQYRWMVECILSSFATRSPALIDALMASLSTNDHHGSPKFLASLVRITVNIACSSQGGEHIAQKLIERIVSLCSSTKIVIRHEAQWSFTLLWTRAEDLSWPTFLKNPALKGLVEYIRSQDKSMHLTERENSALNLDTDRTLSTVLCGRFLNLEPAAAPLVSSRDFQRLQELDEAAEKALREAPKPTLDLGSNWTTERPSVTPDTTSTQPSDVTQPFSQLTLQTKGTSYLTGSAADFKASRLQSGLLVVGSLVGDPHNIGGISRVAEIFGAAALYISSLSVLTNKQFESVAVSSHQHMDVKALKMEDMVAFFAARRVEGYAIVGIEQTDRSAILGAEKTRLPRKTILVLGAEKEGMPAAMLAECDILVEIPQRGFTRSMNVQTAAACVLYEYCRQHS